MKYKTYYTLPIFIFVILNISAIQAPSTVDSIEQHVQLDDTIYDQHVEQISDMNTLVLSINAINNIMTWTGVIIAIFTLIVAFFQIVSYFRFKDEMKRTEETVKKNFDDFKRDLDKKIAEKDKIMSEKCKEIDENIKKFNDCICRTEAIEREIRSHEKYMKYSILHMYTTLDKIANQIENEEVGIKILDEMLRNYHVMNLYSTDCKLKFGSLAYFENNGTRDDIQHLEYVSQNELEVKNCNWAREIIGIIRNKKD